MTHVEIECPCVPFTSDQEGTPPGCLGCKGTLRVTKISDIKQIIEVAWLPPVVMNGLKNDTCRD